MAAAALGPSDLSILLDWSLVAGTRARWPNHDLLDAGSGAISSDRFGFPDAFKSPQNVRRIDRRHVRLAEDWECVVT